MTSAIGLVIFTTLISLAWAQRTALQTAEPGSDALTAGEDALLKNSWGRFLTPAPVAVWALGELMLLSSREGVPDFALQQPRTGFQYLNNPKSFRASLVQLANNGSNAFRIASDNMRNVKLNMDALPSFWSQALNFANKKGGSATLLRKRIELSMKKIVENTDQCVVWASDTSDAFKSVEFLMNELLETSTATKGAVEEDLRNATFQIELTKKLEEVYKKQLAEVTAMRNETEKTVKELQKVYNNAIKAIPSGWEIIGQQFVKSLANTALNLANTAANAAIMYYGGPMAAAGIVAQKGIGGGATPAPITGEGGGDQTGQAAGGQDTKAENQKRAVLDIYHGLQKQLTLLQGIAKRIYGPGTEPEKESPHELISNMQQAVTTVKTQINELATSIQKTAVMAIIEDAETIAQQMSDDTKTLTNLPQLKESKSKVPSKLDKVLGRLRSFIRQVELSSVQGGQAIKSADPITYQGEGGLEKYKADMALARVTKAEEDRKFYFQEQQKLNEQLAKTMTNLADLSKKEIDFNAIAKTIAEAIEIIAKIQQSWKDLSQFFSFMSAETRSFSDNFVSTQIGQINITLEETDLENIREGVIDILSENQQAFVSKSRALGTIADTYQRVSEKYIMGPLAGISALLNVNDPAKQRIESQKLKDRATTDKTEIGKLVLDGLKEIEMMNGQEIAQLNQITQATTVAP